ncbi:MAG: DNA double-strand break repair nuclease NurA [Thermoflexus sp.]|nr:DNA double-strand break repair nuclease NurA [Thermoflexus sp.]
MLDWRQVRRYVQEMANYTGDRLRVHPPTLRYALSLLHRFSEDLERLQRMGQEALRAGWRGAIPWGEPLAARFPLPPEQPQAMVIAADGSQIYPDRHGTIPYFVLNIGLIEMRPGSGAPPETWHHLVFWYREEELFTEDGEMRALNDLEAERDIQELEQLTAAMAQRAGDPFGPPVGLADGMLLPWALARGEPFAAVPAERYRELFHRAVGALEAAKETGGAIAGYVDRPTGHAVLRLLALGLLDEITREKVADYPFGQLRDRALFAELLEPGERSALFAHTWPINDHLGHKGHRLLFFYLNVGTKGRPHLARVEIPEWVARDQARLDRLHRAIWDQCQILAEAPYPYLLTRAHELARIRSEERKQLEQMIQEALLQRGFRSSISAKAKQKEWLGR